MKVIDKTNQKLIKARNLKDGECCYIKNHNDLYMKIPTSNQREVDIVKKENIMDRYGRNTYLSKLVNLSTGRIKCIPVDNLVQRVESHVEVTDAI